jgi:hypothetical protein
MHTATYSTILFCLRIVGLKNYKPGFIGPLEEGDTREIDAPNGRAASAWALSQVGSDEYGYLDMHPESRGRLSSLIGGIKSNKCNAFVWDALTAGGNPPGRLEGGRIPSASEWADADIRISGYYILPPGAAPKAGDVVATGGHVGLYMPLPKGRNGTISARAGADGEVVHNDWGFRPGQTPVIRRCGCDGAP